MSDSSPDPETSDDSNPESFPTPFQRKTIWNAVTALSMVLIGGVAVGLIILTGQVLGFLQPVLVPIAIAGIIAYLLEPVIVWLTKKGWKHKTAMMTVYTGFMLFVVFLIVAVIVPTVGQAQDILKKRAVYQERLVNIFTEGYEEIENRLNQFFPGDQEEAEDNAETETSPEEAVQEVIETVEPIITSDEESATEEASDSATADQLQPTEPVVSPNDLLADENISKYAKKGLEYIADFGPKVGAWIWERISGVFGFFGYILGLLLVPIYLFFFLREGHSISSTWADYLPLKASQFKDELVSTLKEINQYLIAFFRGQMVVSLIDGALVAIALLAIQFPYALLIGVFLAILGLIPYIGNLMVMIPALLIAAIHFGASQTGTLVDPNAQVGDVAKITVVTKVQQPSGEAGEKEGAPPKFTEVRSEAKGVVSSINEDGKTAKVLIHAWSFLPHVWAYPLIVLGIFVTLQQINGLVTAPKIVGDSVGLHPLTVIFSVLFWSLLLGGLLGALLAVPLTAALKVLFRRYIWEKRIESRLHGPDSDSEVGAEEGETFPPGDENAPEPSAS